MSCENEAAQVARLEEALGDGSAEHPVGRALLLRELAGAKARLRQCRGEGYSVGVTLLDLTGSIGPASMVGRLTLPGASAHANAGRLAFAVSPLASTALVVETAQGGVLARSPAPLPGVGTGGSDLTILVPPPTIMSPGDLSSQIPPVASLGPIPPIVIPTFLGPFILTITLTSLALSLGADFITITFTGSIVTGPSAAQAATTVFTHSANYALAPVTSPFDWQRCIAVSAPAAGTLTLTPTAGWAFFRPLGFTMLWASSSFIESTFRARVALILEGIVNSQVQRQLAGNLASAPLPQAGQPVVSMRSLVVRPSGLSLSPSVSVHV